MARPKKAPGRYQPVTIRFPADVFEQSHQYALQEDRSLNEQVIHIVKAWLAAKKQPASPVVHAAAP